MTICWKPLGLLLLVGAMVACAAGQSETSSTVPDALPQKPKPKRAKHVYTEEDLRHMRGGVSVVGDGDKPPAASKPAASPKRVAKDFTGLPAEETPKSEQKPAAAKEANCPGGTLAYGVESVLADQGIELDHEMWESRLFGGPGLCKTLPSADAFARQISGDYTTADARHFRISATVFPTLPPREARLAAEAEGRHFLALWRGNVYVVDEFVYTAVNQGGTLYRNGIESLELIDTYHGITLSLDSDTAMKERPPLIDIVAIQR